MLAFRARLAIVFSVNFLFHLAFAISALPSLH